MKTIFLNLHSSRITGPADYLKDFLLREKNEVLYLSHPLDDYKGRYTEFRKNNKILEKIKRKNLGILNLFFDFFISLKYILSSDFEVFIGANNFDVLPGILIKKISDKKIEKIIYFASDFSEDRFKNKILDAIYYKVEKIALKNCDLTISNTKRAEEKRLEFGLNKSKSLVVPNGVYLEKEIFEKKKINKRNFIFVGNVTKEHGLYSLLEVLHSIIDKFVLIGSGDDWDRVVGFCKEKNINLESYYRRDHKFTLDYLQKFNGIGLAPYNLDSKWTYYCSPLKVNEYIACGVPVLMSDVPEIADFLDKGGFGMAYRNMDFKEIEKKIKDFDFTDYYKKAYSFYEKYSYDVLYKGINFM